MAIKAIFFDMGGVVVKENRQAQFSQLSKLLNADIGEFNRIRKKKLDLFKEGKISAKQYLDEFAKAFDVDLASLENDWLRLTEKHRSLNKPVQNTIRKLSRKYTIGTLTNIIPLHDKARESINAYKHFKIKLLSYEQRSSKPKINFYRLILKETGLKSQEIIFIDDYAPFLLPAKKLGMKTILFKDNACLVKDLRQFKVDI